MNVEEWKNMDRKFRDIQWHSELTTVDNITRSLSNTQDDPRIRNLLIREIARKIDDSDKLIKEAQEEKDVAIAERDRLKKELDICYEKMVEARAETNLLREGIKLDSKPSEFEGG